MKNEMSKTLMSFYTKWRMCQLGLTPLEVEEFDKECDDLLSVGVAGRALDLKLKEFNLPKLPKALLVIGEYCVNENVGWMWMFYHRIIESLKERLGTKVPSSYVIKAEDFMEAFSQFPICLDEFWREWYRAQWKSQIAVDYKNLVDTTEFWEQYIEWEETTNG